MIFDSVVVLVVLLRSMLWIDEKLLCVRSCDGRGNEGACALGLHGFYCSILSHFILGVIGCHSFSDNTFEPHC